MQRPTLVPIGALAHRRSLVSIKTKSDVMFDGLYQLFQVPAGKFPLESAETPEASVVAKLDTGMVWPLYAKQYLPLFVAVTTTGTLPVVQFKGAKVGVGVIVGVGVVVGVEVVGGGFAHICESLQYILEQLLLASH